MGCLEWMLKALESNLLLLGKQQSLGSLLQGFLSFSLSHWQTFYSQGHREEQTPGYYRDFSNGKMFGQCFKRTGQNIRTRIGCYG